MNAGAVCLEGGALASGYRRPYNELSKASDED